MSNPPRKPARPTRTPTSRPRKVAGQAPRDVPGDAPVESEAAVSLTKPPAAAPPVPPRPVAREPEEPDEPARGGRLTMWLAAVIVVLLGVGTAELVYLLSDDDATTSSGSISAERPVQVPDLTVRSVVDQAAQAADLILSASAADYDTQVEAATATMTDAFADEYRQTKEDVKADIIAQKAEVTVDLSAQGVVTATADEIVALLFLTQTTEKAGEVKPVQYRVTVTMLNTDDGWLVSDVQAL